MSMRVKNIFMFFYMLKVNDIRSLCSTANCYPQPLRSMVEALIAAKTSRHAGGKETSHVATRGLCGLILTPNRMINKNAVVGKAQSQRRSNVDKSEQKIPLTLHFSDSVDVSVKYIQAESPKPITILKSDPSQKLRMRPNYIHAPHSGRYLHYQQIARWSKPYSWTSYRIV